MSFEDTTTEDLKACPFCNGPAELDTQQAYMAIHDGRIGTQAAVYCTGSCGAQMTLCYRDVPEMRQQDVVAVVVENWNRRWVSQPRQFPAIEPYKAGDVVLIDLEPLTICEVGCSKEEIEAQAGRVE